MTHSIVRKTWLRMGPLIVALTVFCACKEASDSDVLVFYDQGGMNQVPAQDAFMAAMDMVSPAPRDFAFREDTGTVFIPDAATTGPAPTCTDLLGQDECDLWNHCTYVWPGCTQNGVRSLPLASAGCVPIEALCIQDQCSGELTCQEVMVDPCPGNVCNACGVIQRMCLPPVSDMRCGGPDRLTCPGGHYCEYDEAAQCGTLDFGRCTPVPPPCEQPCRQVCGCDGQTYCNACTAAHLGMAIRHIGFCPPPSGPLPQGCIQQTHPDVRLLGRGDACDDLELRCPEGQRPYRDECSCGCLLDAGAGFECEMDADCVAEECCRPTGCVAAQASNCAHDEDALCCFCGDCRPAVESCLCQNGLCRTQLDEDSCE